MSTIYTLLGTDLIKDTFDDINTNFSNLNTDKAEKSGQVFTWAISATNLSGTNTGDETTSTIKSKLGITTLSGSNTWDQTSIVWITGTKAQFDTACTDGNFMYSGDTATTTNALQSATTTINVSSATPSQKPSLFP